MAGERCLSLADIARIALERGGTCVISDGALYPGGYLLSISLRPGVCGGEPCIDGTRIATRFVWDDAAKFARDYEVTLAQAEAAHRWERAARGQA
jgi:uncharacterized protein (DUF433 family)